MNQGGHAMCMSALLLTAYYPRDLPAGFLRNTQNKIQGEC